LATIEQLNPRKKIIECRTGVTLMEMKVIMNEYLFTSALAIMLYII
jgi:hypothetical protein